MHAHAKLCCHRKRRLCCIASCMTGELTIHQGPRWCYLDTHSAAVAQPLERLQGQISETIQVAARCCADVKSNFDIYLSTVHSYDSRRANVSKQGPHASGRVRRLFDERSCHAALQGKDAPRTLPQHNARTAGRAEARTRFSTQRIWIRCRARAKKKAKTRVRVKSRG
eukprot:6187033-Pleurochrysis_carterae.AAC.1